MLAYLKTLKHTEKPAKVRRTGRGVPKMVLKLGMAVNVLQASSEFYGSVSI